MTTLPSEPGFYWWRPYDDSKWRMIHIEPCGTYLGVTDLTGGLYHKARMETFHECSPVGEWVKIEEPK